jgi:hypothetical protein
MADMSETKYGTTQLLLPATAPAKRSPGALSAAIAVLALAGVACYVAVAGAPPTLSQLAFDPSSRSASSEAMLLGCVHLFTHPASYLTTKANQPGSLQEL